MIDIAGRGGQRGGSESRIAFLESIRGLAAVQVLLLHVLAAFAPSLVFSSPTATPLADAIHLSPIHFLYDGYAAVYIFFTLSGYVLTRAFERSEIHPSAQILGRAVRLGVPAMAAVLIAAATLSVTGRVNVVAGELSGSAWFGRHWNVDPSLASVIKDGTINALILGYRDMPGVAFLDRWQQDIDQSLVVPLWTLSIEFYGSLIVLLLCWCRQRSHALWVSVLTIGALFTARSAYVCFFAGHLFAAFGCAETPVSARKAWPVLAVVSGIVICGLAETWQPAWLRAICASPTVLLFPGQFAPMQQKTFGAMLLLLGLMRLQDVRRLLSAPWLVARSRLSFPLYLVHWPMLFGPAAALFLWLAGRFGPTPARLAAIAAAVALSILASLAFLAVDRLALKLSRNLRLQQSPWGSFSQLRLSSARTTE